MLVIRLVDSIENLNPADFQIGEILVTNDGEFFEVVGSDELGGFGAIFSKIAGIAAPFASLIPGFGTAISAGLSIASGLTAPKDLNAKYLPKFNEMVQLLQTIDADLIGGRVSGAQAQTALSDFHTKWQAYKFSVPDKGTGIFIQSGSRAV